MSGGRTGKWELGVGGESLNQAICEGRMRRVGELEMKNEDRRVTELGNPRVCCQLKKKFDLERLTEKSMP